MLLEILQRTKHYLYQVKPGHILFEICRRRYPNYEQWLCFYIEYIQLKVLSLADFRSMAKNISNDNHHLESNVAFQQSGGSPWFQKNIVLEIYGQLHIRQTLIIWDIHINYFKVCRNSLVIHHYIRYLDSCYTRGKYAFSISSQYIV